MKQLIIFLGLLISQAVFAQNITKCEKIVALTVESINKKNSDELEKHLSADFSFAEQKGLFAKSILSQLISQLNDSIIKCEKVSETQTDVLTLVYEMTFSKTWNKQTSTFIFNEKNQLKELKMFDIKVTMGNNTEFKKNNQDIISIPFTKVGNLISVEAQLNGEKRKFLIDNGSPKLILNSRYINKNDTNSRAISNVNGINGSISGMDIQKIKEFDFCGIRIENQDVITMDLSHLEGYLKTEIYGLIGYEILKDYDILFDYKNTTITLLNPDNTSNYLKGIKTSEVPLTMNSHIPIIKVNIGDKELNLGIDCGAESNLLDENLFEALKTNIVKIKNDSLGGADKTKKSVKTGEIKSIKIGDREYKRTSAVFNDLTQLNKQYGSKLDGLIGYDILSKQKTILSYRNNKLIFILNRNATIANHTDSKSLYYSKKWNPLFKMAVFLSKVKANKNKTEANYNKPLIQQQLDSIFEDDQKYRLQLIDVIKKFGMQSKEVADLAIKMEEKDAINLIKIEKILDKYGWLGVDIVGEKGNLTLFSVIQHSDLKTQEKYLPMLKEAVKNGKASASEMALLIDRIEMSNGRPQIYGSQLEMKDGKYVIYPILDEANVNKRRAEVGLEPLEDYLKLIQNE